MSDGFDAFGASGMDAMFDPKKGKPQRGANGQFQNKFDDYYMEDDYISNPVMGGRKTKRINPGDSTRIKKSNNLKRKIDDFREMNDFEPQPLGEDLNMQPEDGPEQQQSDVCAKCSKGMLQVNTEWVQCDTCDEWYHLDCSGLPSDVDLDKVQYECQRCKEQQAGANNFLH